MLGSKNQILYAAADDKITGNNPITRQPGTLPSRPAMSRTILKPLKQ